MVDRSANLFQRVDSLYGVVDKIIVFVIVKYRSDFLSRQNLRYLKALFR